MVDEGDPPAVLGRRDDFVTEHRAGELRPELLDVRAAQPAREHADGLARPVGLREVDQGRRSGLVERDGSHVT
jgi:hypothetical protein